MLCRVEVKRALQGNQTHDFPEEYKPNLHFAKVLSLLQAHCEPATYHCQAVMSTSADRRPPAPGRQARTLALFAIIGSPVPAERARVALPMLRGLATMGASRAMTGSSAGMRRDVPLAVKIQDLALDRTG